MTIPSDHDDSAPKSAHSFLPLTMAPKSDGLCSGEDRNVNVVEKAEEQPEDSENQGVLQQILSTRQVVMMFAFVWIFQFVLAFSSGIFKVLTPCVTSSFHEHALTATTSVVASIASGIIKLPYAKLLNVWGRPQCMITMVACATVGAVMMAACQNVETYCAAQVFWNVGYYGIQFSLIILIADATPMYHRAFIRGFISTPSTVSIWAYGPAAESVLKTIGLGWGFGIWCILIPVFSSPLLFLMFKYEKEAYDSGLITKSQSSRTI